MKRVVLSLLLLIALQTIGPPSAAAGGDLTIRRIRFDPPGADDGSKRSLNKENILIRNDSDSAVRIKGWKVHDHHRDNVYICPTRYPSQARGSGVALHRPRNRSHRYLLTRGGARPRITGIGIKTTTCGIMAATPLRCGDAMGRSPIGVATSGATIAPTPAASFRSRPAGC